MDSGHQDPLIDNKHNIVYFLVLTPNLDAVRLMYYKTFAWPVAKNNDKM